MSEDKGAKVEKLFHEALRLSGDERVRFLDEQCDGDSELHRDVEALLSRDQAETEAPLPSTLTSSTQLAPLAEGTAVDRYHIVRLIAEGGFGEVYLAQQHEPVKRSVALKVLKPGMDSREVVKRFEAERQALAMMDHPAIAHVFDSGATDDRRPYFVMEYVPGVPIHQFCDVERLDLDDRLRLFIDVCRAVHHAHQKGIIHRDLKPSNILVQFIDGKPAAKVIDFGIAKAVGGGLAAHTAHTMVGRFIGTPEYMSPEQAEASGLDIDTRADVYSLGVILYQLLVGVLPIDASSIRGGSHRDVPHAIRSADPSKPSTRLRTLSAQKRGGDGASDKSPGAVVAAAAVDAANIAHRRRITPHGLIRRLRGDLDWIVMKALEKERARRYGSVSEFAADIERFFRHEPVLAGPPSIAYRVRKFVYRNKVLVTAGTIVGLVLVLGIIGTTTQWMRAQRQASIASAVNDILTNIIVAPLPAWDFSTPDPDLPAGPDLTLNEAIVHSLPEIDQELAAYPSAEGRVRLAIGKSFIALSQFAEAETQLRRALELHRSMYGEDDQRTWDALSYLAAALEFQGESIEAQQLMRHVLALSEEALGPHHERTLWFKLQLVTAIMDKYELAAEAASLGRSAYVAFRESLGERDWKTIHAKSLLAFALHIDYHTTEALALAEDAKARLEERGDLDTGLGTFVTLLIGNCHNDLHNPHLALEYYEQARELGLAVYGADSFMFGTVQQLLAVAHMRLGDWESASRAATIGYETQRDNLGFDHPYTQTCRLRVLVSQLALDPSDEQSARDIERFLAAPDQPLLYESFLAVDALILHLLDEEQIALAQRIGKAIEPLIEVGLSSREVGLGPEGGPAYAVQGLLALHAGRLEVAAAHLRRAQEIWFDSLPEQPFPPRYLLAHGTAELNLGHEDRARDLLNQALLVARALGQDDIAAGATALIESMD